MPSRLTPILFARASTALVLLALPALAPAQELITNGGFETGDFTGWNLANQQTPNSQGSFYLGDNSLHGYFSPDTPSTPLEQFPSVGSASGDYYAVSDDADAGAHALIQNVTLPANTKSLTLSFDLFVNDWNGAGALNPIGPLDYTQTTPTQFARVDLLSGGASDFDTGSGVLDNLFLGDGSLTPPDPYTHYSFDLTSLLDDGTLHSGDTLRLRFAEVDNQFTINMGVDNVSLVATPGFSSVPEPGSLTLLAGIGLPLLACRRRHRTRI